MQQGQHRVGFGVPGFRLNSEPRNAAWLSDGITTKVVEGKAADREVFLRPDGNSALFVSLQGQTWRIAVPTGTLLGSAHGPASSGSILSPMPGKIIAVEVEAGQAVTKGQKLLTLEAMKMEHTLVAPFDGVVAELNAHPGGQVQVEALLVRIEAAE